MRIYHGGRDASHRNRERALLHAGADVVLVTPSRWPGDGSSHEPISEDFPVFELPVRREGDINRHSYIAESELARVIADAAPDLIDIHEEPFSLASRQCLAAQPAVPTVMYTAQNIDKRLPPPFAQYELAALSRVEDYIRVARRPPQLREGKASRV